MRSANCRRACNKASPTGYRQINEVIETPVVEAPGEPETPLSDTDLVNKFVDLTAPLIGQLKAISIAEMAATLDDKETVSPLIDAICELPEGLQ